MANAKCECGNGKESSLRSEVLAYAAEKYGTKPEYLWRRLPCHAVLRQAENRKWYGIIMPVSRKKLELPYDGKVDVLNVKLDQESIETLLHEEEGFYPGYNMNKGHWLTVLLDGTVTMERIKVLLDMSHALTEKGAKKPRPVVHKDWLVPVNPKYYDLPAAIADSEDGTFLWKQSTRIEPGDFIYLYMAAPVSAIRYKCEAVETDIPYEYKDQNVSMKNVMKLRLIQSYPDDEFSWALLQSYGISAVRGPRSLPNSLKCRLEAYGEEY